MNPNKEFELVIRKKGGGKIEEAKKDLTGSESSSSSERQSEDETEKAPAQSIVFPVPMELLKAESGCSTVLQCEIQQILKGLLSIEIQLDNEEYECVIVEKSCDPICTPKPPPVLTFPPPPPLEDPKPPTPPPKPQEVYYSQPLRNYGDNWRQSLSLSERLYEFEPQRRVKFTPSPSPGRRIVKPMLRPKTELMAEMESPNFYHENFACRQGYPMIYHEVVADDSEQRRPSTFENQRVDTNPFEMPTMNLEGYSCKAQSTESVYADEKPQETRAAATMEKKKKKFACI